MSNLKKQIAVIGGRDATKQQLNLAKAIGKLLAKNNFQMICGGMGGVMKASCEGNSSCGGHPIGILPGKEKSEGNKFLSVAIATGIGIARNSILAHSADAAIAISGKYGTLSEIAYFLQLEKPVICLDCNWDIEGILKVESPEQAIEMLEKFL